MGSQQCPNCGGYNTSLREQAHADSVEEVAWWVWAIFFLLPGMLGSCAALMTFNILNLILVVAASIFWAWLGLKFAFLGLKEPNPYLWRCNLCYYTWDSREKHEVHVRPDLIAKGTERIEAERRAKEEEIERAMAMKWLEDHKKR